VHPLLNATEKVSLGCPQKAVFRAKFTANTPKKMGGKHLLYSVLSSMKYLFRLFTGK